MLINIRKLEYTDNDYFAYAKSLCGKATFFLHFTDDVWGAVLLFHFSQMLKSYFEADRIVFHISETTISLKNKYVLDLLKEQNDEK
jgi:hypothetical protein